MASIMNLNGIIAANNASLALSELADEETASLALIEKSILNLYELDCLKEAKQSWEIRIQSRTLISKWNLLIP